MPDDRLILALDLPDAASGLRLAQRLGDRIGFYKIGLGMLAGGGLPLARELKDDHGKRVFLDMKLFDISATVAAAVRELARLGIDFLTVHGDPHVVNAARDGAGGSSMKILAVTVLTSLDRSDLDAGLIAPGTISDIAAERASRAFGAGAHGVIASPREVRAIRRLPEASGKIVVAPGVRPAGAVANDQKRVATPKAALAAGADHIVVGRPIWQAPDPGAAAGAILNEIA